MKKVKIVKICPQCKSEDVNYATQFPGANMGGGDHFYCKSCGYGMYQHAVFDEVIINRKENNKLVNNKLNIKELKSEKK